LKFKLFILTTLVYFAELLTDFSYTNFSVSYTDALDRLRVHLNIILLSSRIIETRWFATFSLVLVTNAGTAMRAARTDLHFSLQGFHCTFEQGFMSLCQHACRNCVWIVFVICCHIGYVEADRVRQLLADA